MTVDTVRPVYRHLCHVFFRTEESDTTTPDRASNRPPLFLVDPLSWLQDEGPLLCPTEEFRVVEEIPVCRFPGSFSH